MESLLWAADLIAVTFLCFWAFRQDSPPKPKKRKHSKVTRA
jgi:hypothetical protein